MKEIKFTNLQIKNFRNINEMNIDFGENQTILKGKNKLGKTNILHSILWCLFGKNIYDEKQFTISPIIDNVEDNSINTNVKLTINGEYIISRSYHNRTTKLEVGFIDGEGKENLISMTQTQYLKDLEEKYIDEETFKSLSNIEYITNMHWKDLKELIFELIGGIKDEEVLLREDFSLIDELIRNFGIEKTIEQVSKTEKELNEDIKLLENEYQTTLNMKEKYVAKNEESEELIKRKQEIEETLSENKALVEKNDLLKQQRFNLTNQIEDKTREIKKLESEIEFANSNIIEYENLYNSSANSVDDIRAKNKAEIKRKISEIKDDNSKIESVIEQTQTIIENLKAKGTELKAKEVKVENSTCPTCEQSLPEERIKESLEKAEKEKHKQLLEIKEMYDANKLLLSDYKNDLDNSKKQLKELEESLIAEDTKEYVIEESDRQKQLRIAKETKELEVKEWNVELEAVKKELPALEEQLEKLEEPTDEFINNSKLIMELDEINTKLATTTTLKALEEDLENVKKTLDTKKDNKILNKEKMQQCIKFNNIKAELLKQKVAKYFKLVNFRTKDFTNDGMEVETFKITNENNVEYKECSQGEKILLGVELLTVIQEFKEIKVPLILDEITVITSEIEAKTQIIGTLADKTKNKIEVEVK